MRCAILTRIMTWEGLARDGDPSSMYSVSINAVDADGNAAVHLAAASGLLECVHALVKAGAIISLVNRDQQTCCELADGDDGFGDRPARVGNKALADALEAALVFQPVDDSMVAFQAAMTAAGQVIGQLSVSFLSNLPQKSSSNANMHTRTHAHMHIHMQGELFPFERTEAMLVLDTTALDDAGVGAWTRARVSAVARATGLARARAEAFLAAHQWDEAAATHAFAADPEAALKAAHMGPVVPVAYVHGADGAKGGDTCSICGDAMAAPAPAAAVRAGEVTNGEHVALSCAAGHVFCLECVGMFVGIHVREGTGVSVACPGYQCAEQLAPEWTDLVLGDDTDLALRLARQRAARVVDCCGALRKCNGTDCGFVLCGIAGGSGGGGGGGGGHDATNEVSITSMPRTAFCPTNHAFCVLCSQPAHSPARCDDAAQWAAKVASYCHTTATLFLLLLLLRHHCHHCHYCHLTPHSSPPPAGHGANARSRGARDGPIREPQ